ncbi:hypothetical protein D0868_04702 [Hortaea werneckii]|uniref:Enoyl reductase (ER) domain-containing protein n=1 Tax=Hortaea werneckii TaxID=91943 RepID=A0A3M6Z0N9_HORWE|nr:hypothetical protein D0868_04702 [Hortaea werneckii]
MAPALLDPEGQLVNGVSNEDAKSVIPPDVATTVEKLSKYGNPALFTTPDRRIEIRDTEIPTPAPTEALIHVRCTGICGSDMHFWHSGQIGPLNFDRPCVLGHEPSGVVMAVGSEVRTLRTGDRVAIEPGVPCRKCWLCDAGKYNLCEEVKFIGVCPYAGSIRRFITHEAKYCHKLPHGVTFSQGALLEPLSVVLNAVRGCSDSLAIGKPALVCGAGPIGLCALACVRASGAWPIVITDVDEAKLDFARKFMPGVKTYKVQPTDTALQTSEGIREVFGVRPRDVQKMVASPDEYNAPSTVIECTGIEISINTAALACRRNGVVMVVGVGRSIMNNLPFMHLSLSQIDLRFINRYSDTWPAGINALQNKQVMDLDGMVTHTYPLDKAIEAMEACSDPKVPTVKVQIVDDTEVEL